MPNTQPSTLDSVTIAEKLRGLGETDKAFVQLVFENPEHDNVLFDGLALYIDRESEAKFLNSLKLERCGEWLGNTAPARLQIRLMEAARSSQHPAYLALRNGLVRSGGLERAYPKASV